MASLTNARRLTATVLLLILLLAPCATHAHLSPAFYAATCPELPAIVRSVVAKAVRRNPTLGAAVLRLFFHDCFVNGCDASVLLDDTPAMVGEKSAGGNANSLRGFGVIDAVKSRVEAACRSTVSCADILALASRDAVNLLGGPSWTVLLGRRDSLTASLAAANANLLPPSASLASLKARFAAKGLSLRDLTALSGAHTVGTARCVSFRPHMYNDADVNPTYAAFRRQICPRVGGDAIRSPLDATSPNRFDISYYRDLMARRSLLHSDQELFNGGPTDELVRLYSVNGQAFHMDFAAAMVKMGNISPLTGAAGEIRTHCRRAN